LKGLPIEPVYGDCSDKESLHEAVKAVDQVFHVAGVTKAAREETYFRVNAMGTDNLIHACLEENPHVQKFVYLSSQAAAGPCRNGMKKTESDHCEPISPYGQSKRMGEELALAHVHELPLIILRPSAVYGPRERDIYAFFKIVSKRLKPCLSGQDQRISLCYVNDLVQATLLAAESKGAHGEIFFVSDGQDYGLEEIGDIFARVMGVTAFCIPVPEWVMYGAASLSEYVSSFSGKPPLLSRGKVEEVLQRYWVCDITKARTTLGFEPQTPLTEGARRTYEWYRQENWL
jgi:nucleoside-diphosphate-sugar epimerase